MPSIFDITPLSKKVTFGAEEKEIEFFGVPMREVVGLLKRWPDLAKLLSPTTRAQVDLGAVVEMVPEFAAAAIAASARLTEPEDEAAIGRLSGAEMAKGFAAFAELSLPPSMSGPFVEFLAARPSAETLLGTLAAGSGKGPDTSSPLPSTG